MLVVYVIYVKSQVKTYFFLLVGREGVEPCVRQVLIRHPAATGCTVPKCEAQSGLDPTATPFGGFPDLRRSWVIGPDRGIRTHYLPLMRRAHMPNMLHRDGSYGPESNRLSPGYEPDRDIQPRPQLNFGGSSRI